MTAIYRESVRVKLLREWNRRDCDEEDRSRVIADVLAIVCDAKTYPPRGGTEEERIPEDISAYLAQLIFGVDAYRRPVDERENVRARILREWDGRVPKEEHRAKVIDDVIAIVCDGKKYPPRGRTEEYRIPEDISTGVARRIFGADAYN